MTIETKIRPELSDELTPAARAMYFQQTQSLQEDRVHLADERATWWKRLAIVSLGVGVLGMVCAATAFPLKTHEVEFRTISDETGWVGPAISAKDAPAHFSQRTIEAAMRAYIEARENYLYETDQVAFHRVTIMSTRDEQVRYKAKHDAPDSPASKLRDKGYVQISKLQFYPLGDGKRGTYDYAIKFERRFMLAGRPVPDRGEPCSGQIAFSFHPEYPMTREDAQINPWGMQTSSYDSHSDIERRPS